MHYVHLSRVSTVTGSSETALNTGHAREVSQKDEQHAILALLFLWHSGTQQQTHHSHHATMLYACRGVAHPHGLPFTCDARGQQNAGKITSFTPCLHQAIGNRSCPLCKSSPVSLNAIGAHRRLAWTQFLLSNRERECKQTMQDLASGPIHC